VPSSFVRRRSAFCFLVSCVLAAAQHGDAHASGGAPAAHQNGHAAAAPKAAAPKSAAPVLVPPPRRDVAAPQAKPASDSHAPAGDAASAPAHAPAAHAKSDGHGAPAAAPVDAEAAWRELAEGNARFVEGRPASRDTVARRKELEAGQRPKVAVLTCSDSRVAPEIIFDQGLGDLFVVRTAGATADPVALGSLEYAVEHLHVGVLLVLGHEKCGAVGAAASGGRLPTDNLETVARGLRPALARLTRAQLATPGSADCVGATVDASAVSVLRRSAVLHEAVASGKLAVLRAVYSLDTGEVVRRAEPAEPTPATIWETLAEGNRRFVEGRPADRDVVVRRRMLAEGQAPQAIVLTCADSRVAPEAVFDQSLGDLFVVRNAGNLPDQLALGSIEYAVEHLHARLIVVMGHEKCGAVAAAGASGAGLGPNLRAIVDDIAPALVGGAGAGPGAASAGPVANAARVARSLVERSEVVRHAVASGEVAIVTCLYELGTGRATRCETPSSPVAAGSAACAPRDPARRAGH
jgi:carbonic anhydrase